MDQRLSVFLCDDMGLIMVPKTSNEIKTKNKYHLSLSCKVCLNGNNASDDIYITKAYLITEVFIIIHHLAVTVA